MAQESGSAHRGGAGSVPGDTLAAANRLRVEVDTLRPLARGDSAFAARDYTLAYVADAAAARSESGYRALWRASETARYVGDQQSRSKRAREWYRRAEEWGRRAVAANPSRPEGHSVLAAALGALSLRVGVRQRVMLSKEIRREAIAAIKADSTYPGGWHILGRWNAEVMRLGGAARFFARTFLGAPVFGEASREKAEEYLARAVELEPGRIAHHGELARVRLERGDTTGARAEFERVLGLAPHDPEDPAYREEATRRLHELP